MGHPGQRKNQLWELPTPCHELGCHNGNKTEVICASDYRSPSSGVCSYGTVSPRLSGHSQDGTRECRCWLFWVQSKSLPLTQFNYFTSKLLFHLVIKMKSKHRIGCQHYLALVLLNESLLHQVLLGDFILPRIPGQQGRLLYSKVRFIQHIKVIMNNYNAP